MNKKYLCPDFIHGLYVERDRDSNPTISFCCNAIPIEPVTTVDIKDAALEQQREYSLKHNQLPPNCIRCIDSESAGNTSRRLQIIDFYKNNNIEFENTVKLKNLDFNCQTVCNLKCIMCGSAFSSSWREDEEKLGMSEIRPIRQRFSKNNSLINTADFSALRRVHFNGGEPFMSNDHIQVMQKIIEHGQAHECEVSYNTNGTFFPNDKVIEMWKKFKLIKVYFSIDAIGDQFEYIRFPGNWHTVQENFKKWKQLKDPCVIMEFNVSVGVQNVLYLKELVDWAENTISTNSQGDPINISAQPVHHSYLSLINFPRKLVNLAVDTLNDLSYYSWSERLKRELYNFDSLDHKDPEGWKTWLEQLDQIRHTNWKVSLSKLDI